MKLKLIEAAVLTGILLWVLNCTTGKCFPPVSRTETCLNLNGGGSIVLTTQVFIDGTTDSSSDYKSGSSCPPSDNGSGGPLPSPNTADSVPGTAGQAQNTHLHTATNSPGPPHADESAGSGSTAGGMVAVPWLNLPFTPVIPSLIQKSATCSSSQPDIVVVDHGAATLVRYATCPFSIKATIPLVSRPLEVVVTPDGTQAVVSNFDNAISFVSLQTNTVISNLSTGSMNPSGVAVSPDGKTAYVTSFSDTNPAVMVVDIPSRSIRYTIPLGTQWPHSLALTPDGAQLYVAYPFSNQIDLIDTLTGEDFGSLGIGSPYGIDFSPNGTRVYIASAGNNPGSILALDTKTYQIVKTYTVGSLPTDVRVTYGGSQILVTNYLSNSLSVINTLTGQVTSTAALSGPPMGLVRVQ